MDASLRTPTVLTSAGRDWLQERLDHARARLERVTADLETEHSAELMADRQQLHEQIDELTAVLREARAPGEIDDDASVVELGDEVEVELPDGQRETFWLVHPLEAGLDEHRTSADSPLAAAVLGAREGDRVTVTAPAGVYHCTVCSRRRLD